MATADVRIYGQWLDADEADASGTVYLQRHDTIQSPGAAIITGTVERTTLVQGSIDTVVVGADPDDPNPLVRFYRVTERLRHLRGATVYDIELDATTGEVDLTTVQRAPAVPDPIYVGVTPAQLAAEAAARAAGDEALADAIANLSVPSYDDSIPDDTLGLLDSDTMAEALTAYLTIFGLPPEEIPAQIAPAVGFLQALAAGREPTDVKTAISIIADQVGVLAARGIVQSAQVEVAFGLPDDSLGVLDPNTAETALKTVLVAQGNSPEVADALWDNAGPVILGILDGRQPTDVNRAMRSNADILTFLTASLMGVFINISGLATWLGDLAGALGGKADLVGGKVSIDQLPALAITSVFTAENEAEHLGLDAQEGDVCVRIDQRRTYMLSAGPSNELESPTADVASVNGQVGDVVLTAADVGADTTCVPLGNFTNLYRSAITDDLLLIDPEASVAYDIYSDVAEDLSIEVVNPGPGKVAMMFVKFTRSDAVIGDNITCEWVNKTTGAPTGGPEANVTTTVYTLFVKGGDPNPVAVLPGRLIP